MDEILLSGSNNLCPRWVRSIQKDLGGVHSGSDANSVFEANGGVADGPGEDLLAGGKEVVDGHGDEAGVIGNHGGGRDNLTITNS